MSDRRPSSPVLAVVVLAYLFCAALISIAQAQSSAKPLSKDTIVQLLKGSVSPKRVEELALKSGIDFPITPETETELRQAGANDELLTVLRTVAPKNPVLVIQSTPGAARVYVDDEPVGTTSAEGRLKLSTLTPGRHSIRLSLEGYADYTLDVELRPGLMNEAQAKMNKNRPLEVATAQSPFDGTWKFDVTSLQFTKSPDVYLLQNGMYNCKTCKPPISIKADGTDQTVTGHTYFDTMSVKVIDDRNVEITTKRGGKLIGTEKDSISADGKTLTINWTDSGQASGGTQAGTFIMTRIRNGPVGANLISGSWQAEKAEQSTESGLLWTFKLSEDEVTMTAPTGQSYTAKLDGSDAPYKGDLGITSVSVKVHGKDTLEETDKRNGKVIAISKMTVKPDGKTMKIVYEDKIHGTITEGQATKQ